MNYDIKWSEESVKDLSKIEKPIVKRIMDKVESIKSNPFDHVKRLKAFPFYSLRVGDYRVIMSIENQRMIIFIVRIGHRRDVYEKL